MVKVYLMRLDEPQTIDDVVIVDSQEKAEMLVENDVYDDYECIETLSDADIEYYLKN